MESGNWTFTTDAKSNEVDKRKWKKLLNEYPFHENIEENFLCLLLVCSLFIAQCLCQGTSFSSSSNTYTQFMLMDIVCGFLIINFSLWAWEIAILMIPQP